jgi:hypothetical protein
MQVVAARRGQARTGDLILVGKMQGSAVLSAVLAGHC